MKKLAAMCPFTVPELQRQFAYDRLLARVFVAPDAERWVLKGATALLARLDVARHSKDVDLTRQSTMDHLEAERALRAAAARDLGDFFIFELGVATPLVGDKGRRYSVVAGLGGRTFATFSIDLVIGGSMTGTVEMVPPLVAIEIPGLVRVPYRIYPLVDHIADKVSACVELRIRPNGLAMASTRYKDLVDLVLVARTQTLDAAQLRRALLAQAGLRGAKPPTEFAVPGPMWPMGYEAKAAELQLGELGRFPAAMELVKRLIDPVLAGTATGRWDPDRSDWKD